MPRRRLHGETQKRRQKPAVRTLKLRATTQRKQETRAPLPFEHSPELDPQDVQFLEAMRELRVRRLPGQGGAPVRREAIRRAQLTADADSARLFEAAMRQMGVAPLGPDGRPGATPRPARESDAPRDDDPDDLELATAGQDEIAETDRLEPPATPPPQRTPPARRPPPARPARAVPARTQFDDSEDGARLMEEALRSGLAGLNEKFQGAGTEEGSPPATRKRKRVSRSTSTAEADDELDLHGKTQEEAMRMVQHFLVTAKTRRLRHVLIITGRGLNSGTQGPVLRGAVQTWLERNGAPYLRRFSWAPPRLGGDGAIWVELW
jgi:DNA-nicking Smr family endonuclease